MTVYANRYKIFSDQYVMQIDFYRARPPQGDKGREDMQFVSGVALGFADAIALRDTLSGMIANVLSTLEKQASDAQLVQ